MKRSNSIIYFSCILWILCYSNGLSQSSNQTPDSLFYKNSIHSFQFYLLDEVIAGYRYKFSENKAIRVTVNFGDLFRKEKQVNEDYFYSQSSQTLKKQSRETTSSDQRYKLAIQYVYIFYLQKPVSVFVTAGPYGYYHYYPDYSYTDYDSTTNSHSGKEWGVGFAAVAGIECSVFKRVSIIAELETSFDYGWFTWKHDDGKESYRVKNSSISGIRIGGAICF